MCSGFCIRPILSMVLTDGQSFAIYNQQLLDIGFGDTFLIGTVGLYMSCIGLQITGLYYNTLHKLFSKLIQNYVMTIEFVFGLAAHYGSTRKSNRVPSTSYVTQCK